ncbi:hypothetical protein M407DRAFT_19416 [Tulasnella calospora MUT 4182]|uniref:Uncharacterized protein n=1 Tax=Tulasnella calospora MUT 4182 TaxID=1051891 RepID=A0A0C3MD26_9AGAM|nr:hypothetical protein M407DRAFT_19416 [Tulasnella calospora MUT 4182]
MRKWIEKSKEAPLSIHASNCRTKDPLYEECVALVAENVHRWRFAELNECFPDLLKRINNPPRLLEAVSIWNSEIPAHCRLFQGSSSKLRELKLSRVTLPPDFEALVGLNVLHLRTVTEVLASGQRSPITTGKVQQALEACPNLVSLFLQGWFTLSKDKSTTKPVALKKLQKLRLFPERGQCGALLSLIEAGNCSNLMIQFKGLHENPHGWNWFTCVQGLRRARALRIYVPGIYPMIRIMSMGGPCSVDICYSDELRDLYDAQQAAYSIIESILVAAEKDCPLTTPIQLRFGEVAFPRKDWNIPDPAWLRLLKFLQEPIVDPSSGEKRFRLPQLHSILLLNSKWIKGYLKQFVTAREGAFDSQTINCMTKILLENWVKPPTNILSEVMGYTGETP